MNLTPDNKIISGLWISPDGKPLSNLERLCIHSFCAHGHDFRLWTYGNLPNVPQDAAPGKVEVRDGNEILPESKMFVRLGSLAGFSDWFRWEFLRQKGGWYVDMDVVCLRPFDFAADIVLGESAAGGRTPLAHILTNSAVLKFPAGHEMTEAMVSACMFPNKIQPWDRKRVVKRKIKRKLLFWKNAHAAQKWGEAPEAVSWTAKFFNVESKFLPPHIFEPLPPNMQTYSVSSDGFSDDLGNAIIRNAYAVHLFHSAWKGHGWDKNGDFPADSLYEKLKRRYLPEAKA